MSDVNETVEVSDSFPATGMDNMDVQDFIGFIMGSKSEPPKSLDKMMTNLYQKLQMCLGYAVASNSQRQIKLIKTLGMIEEELFQVTPEQLSGMGKDELNELYKSASKVLNEMNEFERRFLAQNKDAFSGHKTEHEKLAQQLMTLPPEKIESIMKIIRGESELAKAPAMEDELGDM